MSGAPGTGPMDIGPLDAGLMGIGLIGCGFISAMQLAAYREAGLRVVALCDRTLGKAVARREEYAPDAVVTDRVDELLARDDVDIVDIATHVVARPELVERALRAGKHVLSQKPYVQDLAEGRRLIGVAEECGRLLAVNHNGRWAPHFAAALDAVAGGEIGTVTSADFAVYWPHDQLFEHDPHFSTMPDLVVFDFGIHWFDLVARLFADAGPALRVTAAARHRAGARIPVATDVEALVEYRDAAATILFRASAARAEHGGYRIEGTEGVIRHSGLSLSGERVEIDGARGPRTVELEGDWWTHGMLGPMAELIAAIREHRAPSNAAATALSALELAFAAQESIATALPVEPAAVHSREGAIW